MKSKVKILAQGAAATLLTASIAAGLIVATSNAVTQKNPVPLTLELTEAITETQTEALAQIVSPDRFQRGQLWEDERLTLPVEESEQETQQEQETKSMVVKKEENPLSSYFADKALVDAEKVANCLNVRQEPDEASELVNTLGINAVMQVLETEEDWSYIDANGMQGWVCSEYLLIGDAAADYLQENADVYGRVAVPNMNIRLRPSVQADILDVAYESDAYEICYLAGDWAYCVYDGPIKGYLSADCLRLSFSLRDIWINTDLELTEKNAVAFDIRIGEAAAEPMTYAEETVPETSAAESDFILPVIPQVTQPQTEATQPQTQATQPQTQATQPQTQATQPQTQAPQLPVIKQIEAFYRGGAKVAGDVVCRSEIYIMVAFSDGTFATVEDGWTSNDTGMMLHAGENVITVSYAGFSSNIVLQVAAPIAPTEPVTQPTVPQPTEPVTQPTVPQPTEPVTQPTVPQPTEPVTQPTVPQPTEPVTQPTETAPQPTESQAPAGNIRVSNVSLNSTLTAFTLNLCAQYGVDSSVIFSVMYHESRFNPSAASASGAIGLMQIIPRYSLDRMNRLGVTNLYDPAGNILVGIDILAEYYHTYGGWHQALTKYRTGVAGGTSAYASMVLGSIGMFQTVYYE